MNTRKKTKSFNYTIPEMNGQKVKVKQNGIDLLGKKRGRQPSNKKVKAIVEKKEIHHKNKKNGTSSNTLNGKAKKSNQSKKVKNGADLNILTNGTIKKENKLNKSKSNVQPYSPKTNGIVKKKGKGKLADDKPKISKRNESDKSITGKLNHFHSHSEISKVNKEIFNDIFVDSLMHWRNPGPAGSGLKNLGNTCFLNSVLQCILYTAPLKNYFHFTDHSLTCKIKDVCFICEYGRLSKLCGKISIYSRGH
jgi:hypothetical protein